MTHSFPTRRSSDLQNAVIEALARLLKVVGRVRKLLIIIEELKSHPRRYGEVEPLVEIFFRHVIGLLRRLGLGLVQFAVVDLIQGDAVARDVHEEISSMGQTVIHLLQSMHDEIRSEEHTSELQSLMRNS